MAALLRQRMSRRSGIKVLGRRGLRWDARMRARPPMLSPISGIFASRSLGKPWVALASFRLPLLLLCFDKFDQRNYQKVPKEIVFPSGNTTGCVFKCNIFYEDKYKKYVKENKKETEVAKILQKYL